MEHFDLWNLVLIAVLGFLVYFLHGKTKHYIIAALVVTAIFAVLMNVVKILFFPILLLIVGLATYRFFTKRKTA